MRNILFQFSNNLGGSTGAIASFVFNTVPGSWIVAGGYNDSPTGFLRHHPKAYDRGRGSLGTEVYLYPVTGNYLSGG
ncbi:unnamed protein product [marine sediment metagenome]|uniref:Uncharacterized protein n=1 Tax=marine sediment metagenome TaxID=412755 RepID=X1V384_9ZZZZ